MASSHDCAPGQEATEAILVKNIWDKSDCRDFWNLALQMELFQKSVNSIFKYPSKKVLLENIWKGRAILRKLWKMIFCRLSQWTTKGFLLVVRWATLDVCHSPVLSWNMLRCLTNLLPKPVRSRAKTFFVPRKAFTAIFSSSSNAKMPSRTDKCPLLRYLR